MHNARTIAAAVALGTCSASAFAQIELVEVYRLMLANRDLGGNHIQVTQLGASGLGSWDESVSHATPDYPNFGGFLSTVRQQSFISDTEITARSANTLESAGSTGILTENRIVVEFTVTQSGLFSLQGELTPGGPDNGSTYFFITDVNGSFFEPFTGGGAIVQLDEVLNMPAGDYTMTAVAYGDSFQSGLSVGVGNFDFTLRAIDPPACPGDIADDFGSLGSDGMVGFGDFLALLGLVGPCPGGTPGCDGDFADDFGTIGPDGMVSFGDFLALLGLVGPCP